MASPSRSGSVASTSLGGGLGRGPELRDHLGLGRADLVFLLEAVLDIHPQLWGQIPDMAHGGHDLVALAQVLGDGLGLGGAFDDHELLALGRGLGGAR